jgi:hypothetical protein
MRHAAVVALCLTGCAGNNRWHNTAYHIDGLAALVGGFLYVTADANEYCDPATDTPHGTQNVFTECERRDRHNDHQRELGGVIVATAAVAALVNLVFMHPTPKDDSIHPNDESQIQTEIDLLDIGTKDERLIQLTKEAAFAARKDNCRVVRLIYQRVHVMNPDFSENGFLKDNTIERCVRQQDTQ